MFTTIKLLIYFWIFMLGTIPKFIRVKSFERRKKWAERDEIVFNLAKQWSESIIRWTGSTVKVGGTEHVPQEGAVLIVSNHQSALDIPLIITAIDKKMGFISKKEVRRLPLVGAWMSSMQCIFMDRKNMRQSLLAINEGVNKLKEGYSLVIYPEGTRSKDGTLAPFKAGSFKLAHKSGVPILPVTINGSWRIMEKNSLKIRASSVEVIIGEPILINAEKDSIHDLAQKAYDVVAQNLK
jgi:1-acyl-sn-glycerol-3-phosphate acyltransferase